LRRFDEDAQTICAASPSTLHARATAAYREALATAGGQPSDRSWEVFVETVAALIASVVDISQPRVAAAVTRLRRLVEENADLLVEPVHPTSPV
jgi:hypothetical protein